MLAAHGFTNFDTPPSTAEMVMKWVLPKLCAMSRA
jgi:hypothetical protein